MSLNQAYTTNALTHFFTNKFDVSTAAAVEVAKGDGTVTAKLAWQSTAGATVTTGTASFVRFEVLEASSATEPATNSLDDLTVTAAHHTGAVTAEVTEGVTPNCSAQHDADPASVGSATAFTVTPSSRRIYGTTPDATAVKLLETSYEAVTTSEPYHGESFGTHAPTGCVGLHTNALDTRPVVLATTGHSQDALSAQYLAEFLNTGVLLTPTAKLSPVTLGALRTEGVTQVDVVGGELAVSSAVVAQLEETPAYTCGGGSTLKTSGGATQYIRVSRISGGTAAETAEAVDEHVPETHVGTASFVGAYEGVNATGGEGRYNDTSGAASAGALTAPAAPTAILADDAEYQDAMAASALSYGEALPILLTTPTKLSTAAADTIATLGIEQVVVMGGTLAIADSVVSSLEALGVEVLRVAGRTYTDTAVQLARFETNTTEGGLGWAGTTVAIARGDGFTDGLVGAVVAGKVPEPVLLCENPTTVGQDLTAFLKTQARTGLDGQGADHTIRALTLFGGTLAISPEVFAQMEADIGD